MWNVYHIQVDEYTWISLTPVLAGFLSHCSKRRRERGLISLLQIGSLFSFHWYQRGEELLITAGQGGSCLSLLGLPWYLPGRKNITAQPMASTDTMGQEQVEESSLCYQGRGCGSQSDPTPAGEKRDSLSCYMGWKSLLWHHSGKRTGAPHSNLGSHLAFIGVYRGRATVFSVMFAWSRVVIVLKFCILQGCPFPSPLARESRLLSKHFCTYLLVYPDCWLLQFQVQDIRQKRKSRELTTVMFFGTWSA